MAKAKSPVPEGYQTVTPALTLDDARATIEWYKKALGAEELSSAPGPDGKLMHAEIRVGNSRIMLSDPVMGNKGPKDFGGSPASLWVYVEDCDALFNRAVKAGAEVAWPMSDAFWGDRFGAIKDPSGYTWTLATRKEDLTPAEMKERQEEFFAQTAGQGANK